MRVGFIGRFQPFHKGHFKAVKSLEKDHEVVIVIGVAEEPSRDNPLNFKQRKQIIEECFPSKEIVGIEDRESDEEWARELEERINLDGIASRNPETIKAVEENPALEIIEHELHQKSIYSGTEVRRRLRSGEEWRYLVPKCGEEKVAELTEVFKGSGINYKFKPGWKRENSYYDTLDS
ncbi:adenylyltransferase/cytidyltransferase family protein [Candidatus Nanohalococcus occultus]|uniref:adenylyltransferase/cytidyltransferase family protein n=1 Tax=Candidatus Nanohalococcus occultus TaxID=2978047 RepID=UPI0039E07471